MTTAMRSAARRRRRRPLLVERQGRNVTLGAGLLIEGSVPRRRQPHEPTRRERLVLREYRPGHVTQRQLGKEWGVGRSAVAMRYLRARRRLGMEAPPRRLKRVKVRAASLSGLTIF
jgi:hypothetical protein